MKKIFTILVLTAALALSVAGLAGCDFDGIRNVADPGELQSDEQIFGFSAASAATVISAMNGGAAAETAAAKKLALANGEVTDEALIGELNGYMMLVESLLSEGGFGFKTSVSDTEGYDRMMSVTYRDMTGNTIEYVMYYNETVISERTERDDDIFEDEETETVSRIDGIIRIDGADYPMEGVSEASTEGDETETEHRLTVTISGSSYLRVEQSAESERGEDEQEYAYSLYENGALTERSAFEYERENDETEIRLEQRVRGEDGRYTSNVFYFDKETVRGKEVILIRVGDRNASAAYTVSIRDNGDGTSDYVYSHAEGSLEYDRD